MGDIELGFRRTARDPLNLGAIVVAGSGIEFGEIRCLSKDDVDFRHILEPERPIEIIDALQAPDDVADGQVAGGYLCMLEDDDLFGIAAALLERLFKPVQALRGSLGILAQTIEQLRRETVVRGEGSALPQCLSDRRRMRDEANRFADFLSSGRDAAAVREALGQ
ncbi:MAG: hypothetical protein EOP61_29850, partial [Sphingomonadales bacterium]